MHSFSTSYRRAFTLVELAIVLVIIGLIVGGVLVGRDLIKAAEISATISQVQKFQAASNTFLAKYGGLPGDLSVNRATTYGFFTTGMTGAAGKRDGNGLIESSFYKASSDPFGRDGAIGETLTYWRDLSDAKLIESSLGAALASGGAPATDQFAVNQTSWYPTAKLRTGLYFVAFSGNGKNYFQLVGADPNSAHYMIHTVNGDYYFVNAITPIEASAMDNKTDDSLPQTGIIIANNNAGQTSAGFYGNVASPGDGCITNATPALYDTATTNQNMLKCTISFRFY